MASMTISICRKSQVAINYLFLCILFLFASCSLGFSATGRNNYALIPAPASLVPMEGRFTFSKESRIILSNLNNETKLAAGFLAQLIKYPTGLDIPVEQGSKERAGSVFMSLDPSIENDEGYVLKITPGIITVRAKSAVGMFYAVQTLRQLLPADVEKDNPVEGLVLSVPACEIRDEPQFAYRGMHLDVGRHLFPVASIKRYIDMIALHKMNTFHWHLTEDQGWRIEIKKYPRLTSTGGFRKETLVGTGSENPQVFDGKSYGGFYTQEQVKEIIAYARSKFVTIIPEIEMPGHSLAALTAYPELSCTGGPFEVGTRWGIFSDVYCAGKETTFSFLEDVLSEVIDLFPGTYIHIGGDECPKDRWEKCQACQKRMKDESLKDEKELQSYFISRIEKFLISKNRKLIGWDEILEGGLAPEATVMSWRGMDGGIAAARQKHDVIMCPYNDVYLYIYQCEPEGQPLAAGGYLPLEKVYAFNPVPAVLDVAERKYIRGLEGCLWSEFVDNPNLLEYMVYPRMFAIAETGWTPASKKDFHDFLSRFEIIKKRYDTIGINYFKGEYRNTKAKKE
jgi:hexosaminidase